ncbi:MAG: hypothetical protein EPN62_14280 [Candidimonas sp.]|nr:MAG: hypothetical protein EPN77_12655 [Candidimonas sp.]TAM21365.1 MAG: hypothetical protein EPN62_14280 [Candidimonas sp.]
MTAGKAFDELFLFSGSVSKIATWLDVCDWFVEEAKRKELEKLPVTEVIWQLRKEDDAIYIEAIYNGKAVVGFGIIHTDAQLWVCVTVSGLGFELLPSTPLGQSGSKFLFWLDDEPLVVGTTLGVSCDVSKEAAGCRAWPHDSADYPEPAPSKRLAQAKELFMRIENQADPVFQLRIGMTDVASHLEFFYLTPYKTKTVIEAINLI